jgi:hypothetical protein
MEHLVPLFVPRLGSLGPDDRLAQVALFEEGLGIGRAVSVLSLIHLSLKVQQLAKLV